MPCLDEALTVGHCIDVARGFLDRTGIAGEVLVSDNGSTDASVNIAEERGARVVTAPARGYGAALQAGIAAARGRYVIIGDSDGSYDFGHLEAFVAALRAGHHLVMGNRFRGGIAEKSMPFLHRYLGNPVLSWIGRRIYGTRCSDFYCGLRGFDRAEILGLGLRHPGMEFALEMVAKAALFGLSVTEVPTTLSRDGRQGRASHLRRWRDGWRSLRLFLVLCPRRLFLGLGLTLSVLGIGTLALAGDDLLAALLGGASAAVGATAVQFAVLSKWLARRSGVHPPWSHLDRVSHWLTLENGLGSGTALVLAGIAGLVLGASTPVTIPVAATVAIVIGAQTVFGGLFVGLLRVLDFRLAEGSPREPRRQPE